MHDWEGHLKRSWTTIFINGVKETFEATYNAKTKVTTLLCGKVAEKVRGKKLGDASIFPITLVIDRDRSIKLTVVAADLDKE